MKTNRAMKIMSIILAAAMLLAVGITAFAAEDGEAAAQITKESRQSRFFEAERSGPKGQMGPVGNLLDEWVENGVITETQAQALKDFAEQQRELPKEDRLHPEAGEDRLEFLVEADVISQETANQIEERLQELKAERQDEFWGSLAEKDILTDEEVLAVRAFMEAFREERESLRDELIDMTREERIEYFKEHKDDFQGPLAQMVAGDILTEEKADALRQILPGEEGMHRDRGDRGFHPNMDRGVKKGMPFGNRNGAGFNPLMDTEAL